MENDSVTHRGINGDVHGKDTCLEAEQTADVLEDQIAGRHQQQRKHRGEQDARSQRDRHGNQELGLDAGLKDQRGHTGRRRE